jgi:hypothetical protein
MQIDRTWTITFEESEITSLVKELQLVHAPQDLAWAPLLKQIINTQQITLPLRSVGRLALELDMVRSRFGQELPYQEYYKKFPQIAALTLELDSILYAIRRKSA